MTPTVAIPPEDFRRVLGHLPTGVAVVTAIDDDGPIGLAVGTLTSVSLDPPLIGFLPAASSTSFPRIRAAGSFCANVLTTDQQQLCQAFARSGGDKFAGVSWRPAPATGSPVLDDVAAWVDCTITTIHQAGDHLIVLGAIRHLQAAEPAAPPLLFHRGAYCAPAL